MRRLLALFAVLFCFVTGASAHDIPASHLDVRVSGTRVSMVLDAPVSGWAHDLPLLAPPTATQDQTKIESLAVSRLALIADGTPIFLSRGGVAQLLPKNRGETPIRILLKANIPTGAKILTVRGRLFPTDPKHRTVLTVHGADGQLLHEAVLTPDMPESVVILGSASTQNPFAVFVQFVKEGIYHIAIGPDHILFVIALLLMGGNLGQLLKVVTAFTVAHSITLILAALGIVRVPSSIVEPTIAASIVFVGVRVLQNKWRKPDTAPVKVSEERLPYAFGFGLVHGFGFAGALAELDLPRQALAVSLFGFNIGVEIGQATLVLMVAPLLALLHRRYPEIAYRLVIAIALVVIAAGAYWFGERISG